MARFTQIKIIVVTTLSCEGTSSNVVHSIVSDVNPVTVNNLLSEGWVLIEIVTHRSEPHDITNIAFVMGLPAETN